MLSVVKAVSCKNCSECIHNGNSGCLFGKDIYSKGYEGFMQDDCIMNDKKFFKEKEKKVIVSPFTNRVIRHRRSRKLVAV